MVGRSGNTILLVVLAALVLAPEASAWAWPADGPVLRPFVSEGDPYTGGQHRGIDIGAPAGSDVRSATTGVVAYAGQLPHQGLCLTIRTEDGWSVTLVHLGSIGVSVGTEVGQGDVVGTIGPSGEPEGTEPYVYLGIRRTADPNGYVDPLTLLPPRHAPEQPAPAQQPLQQQVQPPAPPVPTRRAAPPRSAPHRGDHRAPLHGHAAHRSAARAHAGSAPRPGVVRRQRSGGARGAGRPARERAAHPRPTVSRSRARERRHSRAGEPAVRDHRLAPIGASPVVRARAGHSKRVLLFLLGALGPALLAIGLGGRLVARRFARPPLRKMSETEPAPEERLPEPSTPAHSRRRRVALREWPTAPGACRRLRRSVGHHRPVSPAAGRRRADDQRHGRARNSGHDRRRSRGSFAP
jgi:pyruvate/2-oxoglutarate dehydrogenase complex dihydrolipoamide acyltransferase (E2) component